ncbi:MAG: PIN domain-containing protein [Planctomycetia bacterium]|nr:PIN domain-containing protein [Planctomycetia bacterium]
MYLFDTNVLIQLTVRRPQRTVVDRLAGLGTGYYNTSAAVVMELRQGTERMPDPAAAWALVERAILRNLTVLDFGRKEALRAGDLDAALGRRGVTPPRVDLLIGATAITHGLILVTGNVKDFRHMDGLRVENWFESKPGGGA